MNRVIVFLFILTVSVFYSIGQDQHKHPRLLVKDAEKKLILEKIEQHEWARSIFNEHYDKVSPYVERHQTDPQWILSRYLMNRVEGDFIYHSIQKFHTLKKASLVPF